MAVGSGATQASSGGAWKLASATLIAAGVSMMAAGVMLISVTRGGASPGEPAAAEPFSATLFDLPPDFEPVDSFMLGGLARWLEQAARPTSTPTSTPTTTATWTPEATATPRPPTSTPTRAPVGPPPAQSAPEPPPPPPPPPAPAPASGLDTSPMDAFSYGLYEATNARRASVGLPPLRVNPNIVGIARIRSNEMAQHDYFSHTSPVTGDTAFSLMDKHGVPYAWAGENLALNNYPDAETVAVADQALWDSPSHKENIVNPHYTEIGIALAVGADGKKYFTIVFVGY